VKPPVLLLVDLTKRSVKTRKTKKNRRFSFLTALILFIMEMMVSNSSNGEFFRDLHSLENSGPQCM